MPNVPLSALSFSVATGVSVTARCLPPGNGSNFTGVISNLSTQRQIGTNFQLQLGNASGAANKTVFTPRMLAPSGNETISLSNGMLTDVLNNGNQVFTTVSALFVALVNNANGANTATSMTVGNSGANGWTGWWANGVANFTLYANGVPLQFGDPAGRAVTANSSNEIRIQNNDAANTCTYVLGVCGR